MPVCLKLGSPHLASVQEFLMRKGFLGSFSALLAGTSLAFAQPPAAPVPAPAAAPSGAGQPATAPGPRDAGGPSMDGPRSPYWPNPFCPPDWAAPAVPHGNGAEKPHHELVVWGSAEYLLWWVKDQPLGVPLVTTGTPTGLGNLASPDTAVLFGAS